MQSTCEEQMFVVLFFIFLGPTSVIATSSTCDNEVRLPSLYEQYCCRDSYRGQNIILTTELREKYFMCPPETPASCSSINLAPSCSDILRYHPNAESLTSGYYNITLDNDTVITAYCDMEGVNCDGEGGWMRVAYLNMSDPSEQCPPGFELYNENTDGIRACGRKPPSGDSGGCISVQFPSHNISYTRVCGRVTGYQVAGVDAVGSDDLEGVEGFYVDGVSITRGSPREHVWTFMAGLSELENGPKGCPCAIGYTDDGLTQRAFIQEDYFCESGSSTVLSNNDLGTVFPADPLWDGEQCGSLEAPCCNVTGIPWFNKAFQQPTTDYVELRVCSSDMFEDTPVNYYDIYIK